nr:GGDEF domain-containing protein [Thioalkalivibrio sp.]
MVEGDAGLEDWRRRYLDTLEELDARTRSWTETERVLRQGLSRLTLAADRSHTVLAGQLETLRTLLRSGATGEPLRSLLEEISESILQFDDRVEPPPRVETRFWGRLFGSKAAAAAAAAPGQKERGPLTLARKLLQEMIDELATPPEQRERMLQRVDSIADEIQLLNLGHDLVTLLRPHVGQGRRQTAAAGPAEVTDVLLHLLDRIDVSIELVDRRDAIRSLLTERPGPATLDRAILGIADLVSEIHIRVERQKGEIETFLKQIAERLGEIDSGFQQSVISQREAYEEGVELDKTVNVQVQEIEESVSQAEDLEPLKLALQRRIDVIRTHMQQYRSNEERRIERAEREVDQLNQRLQSVQEESASLRRRLQEERNLALVDTLTGIPNRFAYNERLQLEVARWRRYQSPLVLSIWDIDRFKNVNDEYGHQAGDKALKLIARLFRDHVRETDFVARYGGEEFVVLLPETQMENALVMAELMRKRVESCGFHFHGAPVPITTSCGLSQFQEGDSAEQVFSRADAALYRAKAQGRNRCSVG